MSTERDPNDPKQNLEHLLNQGEFHERRSEEAGNTELADIIRNIREELRGLLEKKDTSQ